MNNSIENVIQDAHEQRSAFLAAALKNVVASVKSVFAAKDHGASSAELPHAA